jgi:hypothetical protein
MMSKKMMLNMQTVPRLNFILGIARLVRRRLG